MPSMSRSQVLLRWFGLTAMLAGAVMLGWFAWQMWGTNIASKQHQREITADLVERWEQPGKTGETGAPAAAPVRPAIPGDAFALLRIPRFGDEYVVPVIEGTSSSVLSQGVGHFPKSAHPGGVGNFAVVAHRVTHGEPFRHFPDLKAGDEVTVETRTHVFTYVLDTDGNDLTVRFTDGWPLERNPVNPDAGVGPLPGQPRLITLTTCSELFHTNYRLVLFGHLASSRIK